MFVSVCAYLLFLQSYSILCHQVCICKHFCDKLHMLFDDSQATWGST